MSCTSGTRRVHITEKDSGAGKQALCCNVHGSLLVYHCDVCFLSDCSAAPRALKLLADNMSVVEGSWTR